MVENKQKGYHYLLTGEFTPLNVRYDVDNSFVEISGSLMYYMQGHNFTFSKQAFIDAVKKIGNKLHLNLWDASVIELEFGIIMEVEETPETYIKSHHSKRRKNWLKMRKCVTLNISNGGKTEMFQSRCMMQEETL